MKLVNFTCPGCGAILDVDVDQKQAACPYCSKTFPVDDEAQHFKMDDAVQAGYEFEKGRQKAQAELAAMRQPPKKRKTWLWVLGWIFIFPVPLTILMLRNGKIDKRVRYVIIALGWLVYLAIAFGSGAGGNKEQDSSNTGSGNATATVVQSSSASTSASSETEISLTKSKVVNEFISAYNSISASPIESVKQGNIVTKWFGSSYGYRLTMLHANDTSKIDVTIDETNENADAGVAGMRDVFHDCAKAIDPSLTDEDIYGFFDRAVEDPSGRGDQLFGSINVFWSPDVDLSSGHSRGYIRLSAQ